MHVVVFVLVYSASLSVLAQKWKVCLAQLFIDSPKHGGQLCVIVAIFIVLGVD